MSFFKNDFKKKLLQPVFKNLVAQTLNLSGFP